MSGGLFCGMSCAKREQIPSTIRVISSFFIKVSFHLRRNATRHLNLAREVGGDGHANQCKTMFRLTILLRNIVLDRKSTRLNSSHRCISYAVFCLKKKKT